MALLFNEAVKVVLPSNITLNLLTVYVPPVTVTISSRVNLNIAFLIDPPAAKSGKSTRIGVNCVTTFPAVVVFIGSKAYSIVFKSITLLYF